MCIPEVSKKPLFASIVLVLLAAIKIYFYKNYYFPSIPFLRLFTPYYMSNIILEYIFEFIIIIVLVVLLNIKSKKKMKYIIIYISLFSLFSLLANSITIHILNPKYWGYYYKIVPFRYVFSKIGGGFNVYLWYDYGFLNNLGAFKIDYYIRNVALFYACLISQSSFIMTVRGLMKKGIGIAVVGLASIIILAIHIPIRQEFVLLTLIHIMYYVVLLLLMIDLVPCSSIETTEAENFEMFEKVNINRSLILFFITFGIYGFIWLYTLVKRIRVLDNKSTNIIGEYLSIILIPFYSLYWIYTRSQDVYRIASSKGAQVSDSNLAKLILTLFGFGIVAYAMMQNDLNTIGEKVSKINKEEVLENTSLHLQNDELKLTNRSETSLDENIEAISKLSALKDMGIITEEEFLEKKKQLLSRM